MKFNSFPVVDLFAGPGGLGEGFSAATDGHGRRVFDVCLSIEKDPVAHQTLALRALFRTFPAGHAPDCYYDYIRGDITGAELRCSPQVAEAVHAADVEARNATLGNTPRNKINQWIQKAIGNRDPWVLVGGPPCQAYSLAGRSRMRGANPESFDRDSRHVLYKEYLRIIREFAPAVFVMENVKGILSSTHRGSLIFARILEDLTKPGSGLEYDIRSFATGGRGNTPGPRDFIIRAEDFGIPQMRHRVILFGIRRDLAGLDNDLLSVSCDGRTSVLQAISGLPSLRSRLSKEPDSFDSWLEAIRTASATLKGWHAEARQKIERRMLKASMRARAHKATGGRFAAGEFKLDVSIPESLRNWYHDPRLGGASQHETRSHMRSDLHRYLFASCYAAEFDRSPTLANFPESLLPDHDNVNGEQVPFADRFRVQIGRYPSTTVVSHIGKDGHYYIHPDPSQCRSLTAREAARLQTFPDNYFFQGNRTQQYTQIGNAVPPYLAYQIAGVVADFLAKTSTHLRNRE